MRGTHLRDMREAGRRREFEDELPARRISAFELLERVADVAAEHDRAFAALNVDRDAREEPVAAAVVEVEVRVDDDRDATHELARERVRVPLLAVLLERRRPPLDPTLCRPGTSRIDDDPAPMTSGRQSRLKH